MADPNKYKSVSVPRDTHEILDWLRKGNIVHADLTISKTIEKVQKWPAKGPREARPFVDEAIFCTFSISFAIFPKNWP